MFTRATVVTLVLLMGTPVIADEHSGVVLPEIPILSEQDSVDLLTGLVVANVVSQNCEGFEISDAEWELLNGSAAILAQRFQLDPPQYNEMFLHPAYGVLSRDDGCSDEGPLIQPLIERLIGWGAALEYP
mgnify:FL=1